HPHSRWQPTSACCAMCWRISNRLGSARALAIRWNCWDSTGYSISGIVRSIDKHLIMRRKGNPEPTRLGWIVHPALQVFGPPRDGAPRCRNAVWFSSVRGLRGAASVDRRHPVRIEQLDVLGDIVELLLDGEVARVEAMQFGGRNVSEIRLAAGRSEEHVALSPKDQRFRFSLSEERLPLRVQRDVRAIVVKEVEVQS